MRKSQSTDSSKNYVTLLKREPNDEIVTATSQIQRQSLAGPSKWRGRTSADATNKYPDSEKPIVISVKSGPKETTTIEGKISIVSQMLVKSNPYFNNLHGSP